MRVHEGGVNYYASFFYLQVWGVKYNGNGSKIVSVGDDQEIHIYDCPV